MPRKRFSPCWRFIHLISIALRLGPASRDPAISSSIRLLVLPAAVADLGSPHLIMLWTVMSEFPMAFRRKTDRISPLEKVKGMTYDHIEAAFRCGASKLVWLKHYLRNTLTAKDNREKVKLSVYSPLTLWLVDQVSTPSQSHYLPLISTLTSNSDTHQL